MASDARSERLPDGLYHIRVDGINTEENYVFTKTRGSIRGYDLFVGKPSEAAVFRLRWSGEGDSMMILPLDDQNTACTAIESAVLAAVPPGEVVPQPFSWWLFVSTDRREISYISQIGMEPGLLNNWFWDGNIKYPVSLSLGKKTMFKIERLLE